MFLLIEHYGLPVVTSIAENSTRRDFKSAWKRCPPELRVREHAPVAPSKRHTYVCFFDGKGKRIDILVWYDMYMGIRIVFFVSSLFVLALTHIVAIEFFLYWRYLWFDIPMHFLGGICVALGIWSLPFFRISLPSRFETLLFYGSAALGVGVLWEVFEVAIGVSVTQTGYVFDTVLDLVMDVSGGIVGYGIVKAIQKI